MPKTGTTTLQRLMANVAETLKNQGILYPLAGRGGDAGAAHHLLTWCIRGRHGYTDQSCWGMLRDELDAASTKLAVVSAEGFSAFTAEEVATVARHLSGHDVRVLVYFRNQRDYILSYYKQYVKSNRMKYRHSLRRFLSEQLHRCDYAALIDRWSAAFGSGSVEFRLFDKVKREPGLVEDYLTAIGAANVTLEKSQTRESSANLSPTDDGTRLLRLLNSVEAVLPHTKIVTQLCHRTRRKLKRREPENERLLGLLAQLATPKLSTPENIDFLRQATREFNEKLFLHLKDPADRQFFEF
jgi:hypothetical protein